MEKEEPKDVVLGHKTSIVAQMLDKIGLKEPKQEQTFEDVLDESLAKTKIILEELKAINAKREMNAKQETLEEDFESYALAQKLFEDIYGYKPEIIKGNQQHEIIVAALQKGMVYGSKYQAERMYSDEDIKEAFRQGQSNMHYSDNFGLDSTLTEQQLFEKFKKK